MNRDKKLAFIGAGNMAEALIRGLLAAGEWKPQQIWVSDTRETRISELKTLYGIGSGNTHEVARGADVVVLAVKPQVMEEVLAEVASCLDSPSTPLIISVAAGFPISLIERFLGSSIPIVRVMPNTPAMVGAGAAALASNSSVCQSNRDLALRIFQAVGTAAVVDENLLDAVTGLSGSGPAYGFVMIEALADAGMKHGLGREQALELAAQTLLGAAKMVLESKEHPAVLKDKVCSPGGTTIAGVLALEEGGLRNALAKAVEASTTRARQLEEELEKKKLEKEDEAEKELAGK